MTNTNKMTYVAALDLAIQLLSENVFEGVETEKALAVERLTALKAQTEKRNNAEHKPTKTQVENVGLTEVVREVLRNAAEPLTVSELMARDGRLSGLSNQKVSALLRGMGAEVVKTTEKRVSRFALAN